MRDCFPVLLIVLAGCAQETSPSPVAAAPADPPLAAAVPTELPTLRYYSLPGWPMCASIGAAVRELEEETSGKAEFEIITGSLEELKPQVAVYDLGDTHGLVALDAKGQLVAKLPGHAYGKPEVAEVLGKLLPR